MTNAALKKFLADNAYQLIASAAALILVIIGFYVSIQLFQYSMERRVSALETSDATRQQSIAQQQIIINQLATGQAVIQSNQESNGKKLDEMYSDIKDIRQFLLESK